MPTQKDQIERLAKENSVLKERVDSLTATVDQLKSALEQLSMSHGETNVRLEAVEENLCTVKAEQKELEQDLTTTMLRLEGQQMYSRKQTLLLTGSAVEMPVRGEDTRDVVIKLLSTYLGVTGVNKSDISACHRLKNPKVILVRFIHLGNSDRVYRARTKPKRPGLLIFESLTTERLSVIEVLKTLKNDRRSPVLSYYTQAGRIYVRTSESRDVRPIEIPFGCGPEQIRELCEGKKVTLSNVVVRDQFRAIHGRGAGNGQGRSNLSDHSSRPPNPWVPVSRRNQSTRVPPSSGGPNAGQVGRTSGAGPSGGPSQRGGAEGQSAHGTQPSGEGDERAGGTHSREGSPVGRSNGEEHDGAATGGAAPASPEDPPSHSRVTRGADTS